MSTRNLKVGYRLTRNATQTADKAPYLGIAVPVGSLAYDNILAKMIDAGTFMSKATAQYFLNAFYDFAAEEIAADVVRLNTGAVSVFPMIGGAFDSEDDTFKEPRNTLYIGATLSQDIRNAVAGIVPDYLGDEAAAGSVKINTVFDLATMTNGVINGTNDFRICGIDLTVPDGDDESLTFVKKDGVTKVADIVVSETADGQRITCHLAGNTEAVPKGTYKVRLASHGLDPTAPLTTVTKTVTLVEPVPEPEPLAVSEDGDVKVMTLETLSNTTPCAMTGTNVGYDDAAENGIHEVLATIDGTEYHWKSSKGGGFDASEVTLTFELQPGQEAPAPGAYDVLVAFERTGGSEGSEEIVSTRPVKVVIEA